MHEYDQSSEIHETIKKMKDEIQVKNRMVKNMAREYEIVEEKCNKAYKIN